MNNYTPNQKLVLRILYGCHLMGLPCVSTNEVAMIMRDLGYNGISNRSAGVILSCLKTQAKKSKKRQRGRGVIRHMKHETGVLSLPGRGVIVMHDSYWSLNDLGIREAIKIERETFPEAKIAA